MNEAAANALYEAERKGVKQVFFGYEDGDGGACALWAMGARLTITSAWQRLGLRNAPMDCPCCGKGYADEAELIEHLNDGHRMTFSEIARKLGPDAA